MLPDAGLTDQVAIVTGGSRGIGRAIVETLAGAGMDVSFTFREHAAAAAEVTAAGQAEGRRIAAEQVDVRDPAPPWWSGWRSVRATSISWSTTPA
jgi:3-oxoacyl-[acyl-carrier protein] reductase